MLTYGCVSTGLCSAWPRFPSNHATCGPNFQPTADFMDLPFFKDKYPHKILTATHFIFMWKISRSELMLLTLKNSVNYYRHSQYSPLISYLLLPSLFFVTLRPSYQQELQPAFFIPIVVIIYNTVIIHAFMYNSHFILFFTTPLSSRFSH